MAPPPPPHTYNSTIQFMIDVCYKQSNNTHLMYDDVLGNFVLECSIVSALIFVHSSFVASTRNMNLNGSATEQINICHNFSYDTEQ